MANAPNHSSEHEEATLQGITFLWSALLVAMIVLVAIFALSPAASDMVTSEIDTLALGTANAIGFIALGGVNSIGVVALGMVNAIGVVAIGGVNSLGLISIGGINSGGIIAIGGVNNYSLIWGYWGATIFNWSPTIGFRY